MADNEDAGMNMAAFLGSYLGNRQSPEDSTAQERYSVEHDTLFVTPDLEESSNPSIQESPTGTGKDWNNQNKLLPNNVTGRSSSSNLITGITTTSNSARKQTPTAIRPKKRSRSEMRSLREAEEQNAIQSIEVEENSPKSDANMLPPPKPKVSGDAGFDSQTAFLRSLMLKGSQAKTQKPSSTTNRALSSQSTSLLGRQASVQVKLEPEDDQPVSVQPTKASAKTRSTQRSTSVVNFDPTPPAKRARLQELADRKATLHRRVAGTKARIDAETEAHKNRIERYQAEKEAVEEARAHREAEMQMQEEREMREIQTLEDLNKKLDQELAELLEDQRKQLAAMQRERAELGIFSEDDDEEDNTGDGKDDSNRS